MCNVTKKSRRPLEDDGNQIKTGGLLLSRIALQYHRRRRAKLLCSGWEEVEPRCSSHPKWRTRHTHKGKTQTSGV